MKQATSLIPASYTKEGEGIYLAEVKERSPEVHLHLEGTFPPTFLCDSPLLVEPGRCGTVNSVLALI